MVRRPAVPENHLIVEQFGQRAARPQDGRRAVLGVANHGEQDVLTGRDTFLQHDFVSVTSADGGDTIEGVSY